MTMTATLDARSAASLLRWWADAGVDTLVDETPRHWTAKAVVTPVAEAFVPAETPPADLEAIVAWLAASSELDSVAGPSSRRLAPFGNPAAAIMIVTDMPEAGDVEVGKLLSGEVGELLDKMLAAIGLDRATIYCAPLCPGRPASGRIDPALLPKLGETARRHIAQSGCTRVWLLGQTTSRAILQTDDAGAAGKLLEINQDGRTVAAVASLHPRLLIQHPARKAQVWKEMQLLVGGLTA